MEGVVELAEEMLQMPVRVGIPQHVTGLADVVANPMQATGVGLLIYGSRGGATRGAPATGTAVGGLWSRVTTWFKGEF
jgi:cell division protein FtsA